MVARRGISLLDLVLGLPLGSASVLLPDDVQHALESLAVLEHTSTVTAASYIHEGTTQALGEQPLALPSVLGWKLDAPVVTTGLRFRVVRTRNNAVGGQNVEPPSTTGTVDLYLDPLALTIPGLVPAVVAGGTFGSANPAHLVPAATRGDVRVSGRGILRITLVGAGGVALVDWPDPLNPKATTGAVTELSFDPPTFLVGESGFGATVDRVVVDVSPAFTPADIVARGQDATWQGISLREGTLYLPRNAPIVGDLSIGLHDLLVGVPPGDNGVQGELSIEFGRTPVSPAVVAFTDHDGALETEINAAGYTLVRLREATSEITATLPVAAAGLPADPTASWTLPDGTRREDVASTGPFIATAGESMRAAFTELVSDRRVPGDELTFVFTLAATVATDPLPTIDVATGSATVEHVASLSGSPLALADVSFLAHDGNGADLTWQLGDGADAQSATGAEFAPHLDLAPGTYALVLRTGDGFVRRCEVSVLDQGALVAGAASGPRDRDGGDLGVTKLLATYDLATFDREGRRVSNGLDATVDGSRVDVPDGALASVNAAIGTADDPDAPVPPDDVDHALRHVQVLMVFEEATAIAGQFYRPDGGLVDAPTHVGEWSASFDGAEFLVIGRCCDLGDDVRVNRPLADARAALAISWIDGAAFARGELSEPPDDVAGVQEAALTAGLLTEDEAATGQLIDRVVGPIAGTDPNTPPRPLFRRADIYAVGGTPTDATLPALEELMPVPGQRPALLPGDDAGELPPSRRDAALPFRTSLTVGWDSPSVHEPADAVPTLAELVIEWARENVSIPDVGDFEPKSGGPGADASTEVFTLTGRWTHDPQSGETRFSLSWDSSGDPDGLAHVDSAPLAVALALGPALLGGIGSLDELGVSLVALTAAALLAVPLVTSGTVVLNGIEYQIEPGEGGPVQRLVVDYSVAIGIDSSALGGIGIDIATDPARPMRVRYRNVGLEFDLSGSLPWYETLRLVYDDVALEIEDPGAWNVEGPLGAVLRVVGTRAGAGSTWFEVDLEFLFDLGVVTISRAIVRLTIDDDGDLRVEVRGITVDVDIPGTLTGSGTLSLGDDGAFKAGIDVTVVPAQLTVGAALALEGSFFFLEVRAILPVGIPLGPTGLGLYGFVGRFVTNGTRAIDVGEPDLVIRELGWYHQAPVDKYRPEPGQWALGLGAVVGTALDTGFSFNALGMFVVSFPDPSVIFSVEAHFMSSPSSASDDPGGTSDASGSITGLTVIDPEAVVIAVDGRYELTGVIDVRVPVAAYFPGLPSDTYVRIGADGVLNRTGDPVTATLFPDSLRANVWSYLMIEGGRLVRLGGDPRFTFDGFCVGFGAGWSVEWTAGPASVRASATVLVGLGTKPFMLVGGVFLDGEVSLAFVSIGVFADLVVTVQDANVSLEGDVGATVDLGFFERDVSVHIEIRPAVTVTAPPPPPPLLKVSFVDRNGFVVQQVDAANPSAGGEVWPDTVPVLEFAHPLAVELASESAFQPGPAPSGPEWSGTSKLKYAYRLIGVAIEEVGGTAIPGPLDSAWWWSTARPGIVAEGVGDMPLSSEEGRWLALLTWDPRPWSRALAATNVTSPGDPATTASRLCDPALLPRRACAFGVDAVRIDSSHVELRDDTTTTTLPTRMTWATREHFGLITVANAIALGAARGWTVHPSVVTAIPELAALDEVPDEAAGVFELSVFADALGPIVTMQLSGRFQPALVDASLTLLVLPWDRDPVGDEMFCCDFSNADTVHFTPDGFDFKGMRFIDLGSGGLRLVESVAPANVRELQFSTAGVRIELPFPVRSVRLDVLSGTGSAVVVTATAADGSVVDTARCPGERRRTLVLASRSLITTVTLTGGGGEGELVSICVVDPVLPDPDDTPDDPSADESFPLVFGTRVDGPIVRWVPTVVATLELGGIDCSVVRYDPPTTGRTWQEAEILPWIGGRIGVVSTCGVSCVAQQVVDDQTEYVANLVDLWNIRAAAGTPERRDLLVPDTDYQISVSWQYQVWLATEDETVPPPTDPDGWLAPVDDVVWGFSTAAGVDGDALPVVPDTRDESSFDPRAITRYLLGTEPVGGDTTTHFRDDPLLVHFSVDHVETLLALYGRELVFTVQRTDPPPGSAGRYGAVLARPAYRPLDVDRLGASDARFTAAVAALPCVELPAFGGVTAVVGDDVILEPRARYDLRLGAVASGPDTSGDLLVAVTNFVASRYASPRDLLDALGFTDPDPSPVLPHDAIVTGPPPQGAAAFVAGDAALDATLAALGLDPWPLPVRPRVVALWQPGSPWSFAGLLLEADEAIERPGRLHVDVVTAGGVELDVVRMSSSGTRLLLTAAASIALAPEDIVELTVASTTTGDDGVAGAETIRGTRRLLDQPRLAYAEVDQ